MQSPPVTSILPFLISQPQFKISAHSHSRGSRLWCFQHGKHISAYSLSRWWYCLDGKHITAYSLAQSKSGVVSMENLSATYSLVAPRGFCHLDGKHICSVPDECVVCVENRGCRAGSSRNWLSPNLLQMSLCHHQQIGLTSSSNNHVQDKSAKYNI